MPELPEVENLRLLLAPQLVGQKFDKVELRRKDLRFPIPKNFEERLEGRTILQISRRAKYLLFHLDLGHILVVHLGMTGRLLLDSRQLQEQGKTSQSRKVIGQYHLKEGGHPQHDHVIFYTKNGLRCIYNDTRRFGFMILIENELIDRHPFMKILGVEPLSENFNENYLAKCAVGRKADLKAFLMNQKNIAGLGNIYVCEALFRAGLSPKRRTGKIVGRGNQLKDNAKGLVSAVQNVLKEAVVAGGSTLRDFIKPDGTSGSFQNKHLVYDREGQPCSRSHCKGIVRRIWQNGRSTFYCPKCQR